VVSIGLTNGLKGDKLEDMAGKEFEEMAKELGERLERLKEKPSRKQRQKVWQELIKSQKEKIKELVRSGASLTSIYLTLREFVEEKFGKEYVIKDATFYRLLERLGIVRRKKKLEGGIEDVKTG